MIEIQQLFEQIFSNAIIPITKQLINYILAISLNQNLGISLGSFRLNCSCWHCSVTSLEPNKLASQMMQFMQQLLRQLAGLFIIRTLLNTLYFLRTNWSNITPTGQISDWYDCYECRRIDSRGMQVQVPILFLPMVLMHSSNRLQVFRRWSSSSPLLPLSFSVSLITYVGSSYANPKSMSRPFFVSGLQRKLPGLTSL